MKPYFLLVAVFLMVANTAVDLAEGHYVLAVVAYTAAVFGVLSMRERAKARKRNN